MSVTHGGKGDKQRPGSVPLSKFDSNWDLAFGGGKKKEEKPVEIPDEKPLL